MTEGKSNVLTKIIVPRINVTMRYIITELDEREREETFRLKRVKQKKEREKKLALKIELEATGNMRAANNDLKTLSPTTQPVLKQEGELDKPDDKFSNSEDEFTKSEDEYAESEDELTNSEDEPNPSPEPKLKQMDKQDLITFKKPDDITEADAFIPPSGKETTDFIKEVEQLIDEENGLERFSESWNELSQRNQPNVSSSGEVYTPKPSVSEATVSPKSDDVLTSAGQTPAKEDSEPKAHQNIDSQKEPNNKITDKQENSSDYSIDFSIDSKGKVVKSHSKFKKKDDLRGTKTNLGGRQDDLEGERVDLGDTPENVDGKKDHVQEKEKKKSMDSSNSLDFSISSRGKVVESRSHIRLHQDDLERSKHEKQSHSRLRSLLHLHGDKGSKHKTENHEKENRNESKEKVRILDTDEKLHDEKSSQLHIEQNKPVNISNSEQVERDERAQTNTENERNHDEIDQKKEKEKGGKNKK